MVHLTHISDLGPAGVSNILERALQWKRKDPGPVYAGRILGMLFFNPSLRTRASFESAMLRSGGHAIVIDVNGGSWKLETADGVRMDGDRPEHIREAIPVLGGYVDALAVRCFAEGNPARDVLDELMLAIRDCSTVPVVSMESAREHPCQGLADMLTIREQLGSLRGRRLTLSWAPHVKPLPQAVPNSFLLSAAACGCNVTVVHPPGLELQPAVLQEAAELAGLSGAELHFSNDQKAACEEAEIVYVKSWGPGPDTDFSRLATQHADWMVDLPLLESGRIRSRLMHCLPVRRNVVISARALDSELSLVVPQAHNRLHVQRSLLHDVFLGGN
ncbi:N-acetylornithine carbamoyltransferase [bacterium]|nr:N-acetylornithine carbamoyltransferase [bacterium]